MKGSKIKQWDFTKQLESAMFREIPRVSMQNLAYSLEEVKYPAKYEKS